jgi:hypothetical protein
MHIQPVRLSYQPPTYIRHCIATQQHIWTNIYFGWLATTNSDLVYKHQRIQLITMLTQPKLNYVDVVILPHCHGKLPPHHQDRTVDKDRFWVWRWCCCSWLWIAWVADWDAAHLARWPDSARDASKDLRCPPRAMDEMEASIRL